MYWIQRKKNGTSEELRKSPEKKIWGMVTAGASAVAFCGELAMAPIQSAIDAQESERAQAYIYSNFVKSVFLTFD